MITVLRCVGECSRRQRLDDKFIYDPGTHDDTLLPGIGKCIRQRMCDSHE